MLRQTERGATRVSVMASLGALVFFITFAAVLLSRQRSMETGLDSPAASAPVDPELDDLISHAECMAECHQPCLQVADPTRLGACFHGCEDRCKAARKVNPQQCRNGCAKICATSTDESRAACVRGCERTCP